MPRNKTMRFRCEEEFKLRFQRIAEAYGEKKADVFLRELAEEFVRKEEIELGIAPPPTKRKTIKLTTLEKLKVKLSKNERS